MIAVRVIVSIAGLATLLYGLWLAYPPLAYIVGGWIMVKVAE